MAGDDANATLAKREKERDEFVGKLGERTRTACLGALAVIWGIFTEEKSKDALNPSRFWRISLLSIALFAFLTLAMDFVEYAFAFQHRRKQAGEKVRPDMDYEESEKKLRIYKIGVGAATLLALFFVLGCLLTNLAFGQASCPSYPFAGKWCGASKLDKSDYTCLHVEAPPFNTPSVELSFHGYPGWIPCTNVFDAAALVADCAAVHITATSNPNCRDLSIEAIGPDPNNPGQSMVIAIQALVLQPWDNNPVN